MKSSLFHAVNIIFLSGVSLADIEKVLDQRSLKVRRRPGNAKPDKMSSCNGDSVTIATKPTPPQATTHAPMSNSVLKSYDFQLLSEKELQDLCKRPAVIDSAKLESIVRPIIADVRTNGDKTLLELTEKFDKAKLASPVIDVSTVDEPVLDQEVQDAIDLAYSNIYKFHKAQLNLDPLVVETCKGVVCSRHVRAIEKVSDSQLGNRGGGGTEQSLIRGDPAPRSNLLVKYPFVYHFLTEKVPLS